MARIRSIKPELTAEEEAEFRGLFFGEGHIDLSRSARGSSLMPRLRIGMRDDDAAVVEWCRSLFGGNISRYTPTRSIVWQLTGKAAVLRALRVLDAGTVPSKKRREVQLLLEAVSLVPDRSVNISPSASRRLHELRDELKGARAYRKEVA